MKTIIIISALLLFSFRLVIAQEEQYYVAGDTVISASNFNTPNPPFSSKKKLDLGLNMGSSFGSFYGNSLFTNFVSPEVRYSFSPKFTLTAGTMFTYSVFNNSFAGSSDVFETEASKQARYYLYARGEYQVNENLWIRAGGFADVTPGMSQLGYKSGHVGMTLKLSEETWFNADFQINSGYPGTDLYYSNGGVFGDPSRFGNYNEYPYMGNRW